MTKILAIDDRKDNLITINALLRQHMPGCEVITAQSGSEGIEKARAECPDTILLDVSMPGMDGYEVCRRLKAEPKTANIPVIMITAVRTDTESQVRGYDIGADAYLGKPVDPHVLAAQVRIALRMKRAEDELRRDRDLLDSRVREKTHALEESEARFRSLVEYSSDHIFMIDREGRFVFSNDRVERFAVERGKDLLGKHLKEVYPPETGEKYLSMVQQVYATGKMVVFEYELPGPEGLRYLHDTLYPILRANRIDIVGGICHDISGMKAVELALVENQRRLETLLSHLPGVAYVCSNQVWRTMEFVSEGFKALTECDAAEFIERHDGAYIDFIHPEDRDAVLKSIQTSIDQQLPFEITYRIVTAGGKEKWVWEKGRGTGQGRGEKYYHEGFMTDITERKQLEAQLRQSQKMEAVGRLAGGVAHDFNNMLSIVIGYTGMAMEKLKAGDPLHHDLGEVLKAAGRSADIVSQLLAFSRKQIIEPKALCLNEIVASSTKMLARLVGEEIQVMFYPADDLWAIKMDPGQIQQILANLSVNARDAIPGVGKAIIQTQNEVLDEAYCQLHRGFFPGEYVLLSFSDDGCGMDQATQEQIFDPFFTTKPMGQGTGLGLSIVYGIVKQNNGFINVYSELGHGTTIRIYIPRHAGLVAPIVSKEDEISRGGTETILLVEDEEMILRLARRILEHQGYTVFSTSVPGEALALCEKHRGDIHLLITDVIMPTMSGIELKERVEKLRPGIRTLYMSGYTSDVIVKRGILDKQANFMQKPFSEKNLLKKIRTILD